MLKQIRIILSAMLIGTFFISTLIFSNQTAKACPPRIPASLLSLYMHSDLIILADYQSEKITKRNNENEHGFYANVERKLRISEVYKGDDGLKQISYESYEYKPKVTNSNNISQRVSYGFYGYGTSVPVEIGGQYLFFMQKSPDGKYNIADNLGGVKNIDETLRVYEDNFKELNSIVKSKENQIEHITEWLVNALEEPVTRWGATQDLYNTSNSLAHEEMNPPNDYTPKFALDKTFNTYSSVIAKSLNESQKTRVANLLSEDIQSSWFSEKAKKVDYRLTRIVSNWDKARLATDAFTTLQGFDETKFETKLIIMEFISNIADDRILRDSYYQYSRNHLGQTPETQAQNLVARTVQMQNFNNRFQTLLMQNFEPKDQNG